MRVRAFFPWQKRDDVVHTVARKLALRHWRLMVRHISGRKWKLVAIEATSLRDAIIVLLKS